LDSSQGIVANGISGKSGIEKNVVDSSDFLLSFLGLDDDAGFHFIVGDFKLFTPLRHALPGLDQVIQYCCFFQLYLGIVVLDQRPYTV